MLITYRQYPHPVLSYFNDDYKEQLFTTKIRQAFDEHNLELELDFQLSSRTLKELINEGKAAYVVHLECKNTRFREKYLSSSDNLKIIIPHDKINNEVEVVTMIVAKTMIKELTSIEFNDDFNGVSFNIETGDVLAIDRNRVITVEKAYDSIKKVPSIFSVIPSDDNRMPIDWEPNNEKILIKLSRDNFDKYKSTNNDPRLKGTLAMIIVAPVLTEIIDAIKENKEEFEQYRWFKILYTRLTKLGISDQILNSSSATSIAYKILGDLLEKTLINLEDLVMQGEM